MRKWISQILVWILVASSLYVSPVQAAEASVTQIPNTTRTIQQYDDSFLDVVGFGQEQIHSRGDCIGTEQYRTVSSEREFLQAIADAAAGKVHVIEIAKDLNLGYLEVALNDEEKKTYSFFKKYEDPTNGYTNPNMEKSGVSKLDISNVDGLTIFSKTGCKIKHTELKLQKSANDVVIRNLSFDEMWQWDDTGNHKEVGWTFIKVNGATNVWIDHCSFTDAADGLIDFENGSSGVTLSWCQMGAEATTNPSKDSAIYTSIQYMEQQYAAGALGADSRYKKLRDGGAEVSEIMAYAAYHSKCHLVGSGDKDYCNYVYSDGRVLKDCNAELHLTLAYNYYRNMGQRQPMVRQGVGHLINCYFDNSGHAKLQQKSVFAENGGYSLARGLNARNGASIAADTCVFQDIKEPIVGAEVQGDDTANMSEQWANLFQNAVNHSLIVNSTVSNENGTYTGSSWDNNGDNLFTAGFSWSDKKSIGNWAWSSAIKGVENMDKSNPPTTPFEFQYATDEKLPYTYKVLPLEKVKEVVPQKAGAGKLELSENEWCSVRQSEGANDTNDTNDTQQPAASEDSGSNTMDYPVQKFRIGIGDTNRNINITGFGDHSALNSWVTNGEENEKWYLNYISEGVYKIVNARTGKLITAEENKCTIAADENAANQRWHIEGAEKDFSGNYLYYKITSVANEGQALTFRPDGNRVKLEAYTGNIYQKMKLNCDGLEGFAANCKVAEGEKAGAIGGLLGETIVVDSMEGMKEALVEKRPLTIVVSGKIECKDENYDWRIEDDKTVIGAYSGNQLHDCKLRTNDYFEKEDPSDNIILKNLNIQIDTNKNMMALAIYSSKNIWVDHCTFHCDFEKEYDEVGKFIWINTPYEGKDLDRSPDFLTFSYNRFENRFWGIAFGTQNGVVTEDRASIFYNVFDSVVQRCPQMGNGTMHVNSNYYVRHTTSINNDGMAQIKCGENSVVYSQSNRFEGFQKESSGYWDNEVVLNDKGTFVDYDSYTNKSEKGGGTPVPYKVDGTYTKTTWNPAEQYGFTTLSAYDVNGKNDVKAFCDTYAGMAASQSELHYITDSDMKTFVKKSIAIPFLNQPMITDQPQEEPSQPSEASEESKPGDASQPSDAGGTSEESKPSEENKPSEESKPSEGSKASSESKPSEASQPSSVSEPSEESEPSSVSKPSEGSKPSSESKPSEGSKPSSESEGSKASSESKPSEGSKPSSESKPSEGSKPSNASKPSEGSKPSSESKPSEGSKPGSESKPSEGSEPSSASKPSEGSKPSSASKPSEGSKPSSVSKPSVESKPSEGSRPSEGSKPGSASQPSEESRPSSASKPGEESKPGSESTPSEESKPSSVSKPSVESKPSEGSKPSSASEGSKPSSASKPGSVSKPSETTKPSGASTPGETLKPSGASEPGKSENVSEPSNASQPGSSGSVSKPSESNQPSAGVKPSSAGQPGTPSAADKPSDTEEPTSPSEPSQTNRKKVQSITLKKSLTLKKKQKSNVTIGIKPNDAANPALSVKSKNSSIVKVTKKSDTVIQLQAKNAGITVITVKTTDGSKLTKKLTVKVKPDTVTKLKASAAKGGRVTLSWKKQTNVSGYKIECYDTKTKKWKKVTVTKKNKVTITKAKKKTPYQFRVSSYIKSGKETVYGNTSKIVKITVKK